MPKPCKYCEGTDHYSINCFQKPRHAIKKISNKTLNKKQIVDRLWYETNPPDDKGTWTCYLQLTKQCPIKLTRSTIQLEHVKSKVRHPELKFEATNLKPACSWCNRMKGSLNADEISGLTMDT